MLDEVGSDRHRPLFYHVQIYDRLIHLILLSIINPTTPMLGKSPTSLIQSGILVSLLHSIQFSEARSIESLYLTFVLNLILICSGEQFLACLLAAFGAQ